MSNDSMLHNPHPFNKRRLWNGLLGVIIESAAVGVLMLVALAFLTFLKMFD